MVMKLTVYIISKLGGRPAIMSVLMKFGLGTRKQEACENGGLAVPLTEAEAKDLEQSGCKVLQAPDGRTVPQFVRTSLAH